MDGALNIKIPSVAGSTTKMANLMVILSTIPSNVQKFTFNMETRVGPSIHSKMPLRQ